MAAVEYAQQWTDGVYAAQQAPSPAQFAGVTPEYVRMLTKPTDTFLCPLIANDKGIDFVGFRVRTLDAGRERTLFEVKRPDGMPKPPIETMDDSSRFIRYDFGPEFLDVRTIGANLDFEIGEEPLYNFTMIERHYFRDVLIQNFEFSLPFVIPGARSTWEMIYEKPEFNDEWKAALINSPWETKSDSFYFVDGQLVMHNRAEYNYMPRY